MRLTAILILLGASATGFVSLFQARRRWLQRMQDAAEFFEHVQTYQSSLGRDQESYGWLLRRSSRMQQDMGSFAIMAIYQPPFANHVIHNWQIVPNSLMEMRRWIDMRSGWSSEVPDQFHHYGILLQEAVVRYTGALEGQEGELLKSLRNPFVWFRRGVQLFLALPLTILRWLGLGVIPEMNVLVDNGFFRAFGGVTSVVTFIASVVTIAAGWEKTLTAVNVLWGLLP